MLSNNRYYFFLFALVSVYWMGLCNTLMENDSAQFAVMAMRMVQENDFLHLFKGNEEYLDKPHMHYWLSAASYLIFGIEDWAYRLPGFLLTLLAAYSCYGLGKELYNKESGRWASLIFLSAQTIVLAGFDVRTDSVLTGFTIFSIWQLTKYIHRRQLIDMVLGCSGAALAFSTKGQIAILVIGFPILCHLLYRKQLILLWNWRTIVGLLTFLLVSSPMLYAYYIQFDLHPEKVIRGRNHRSGIYFIFWEQSFERMSGTGIGRTNGDYLFFFHTFLWVFIPWTFLGIAAYVYRSRQFLRQFKNPIPQFEALTIGGFTLIFVLISFAQFKLPHYLNITMPLISVMTAGYMVELINKNKVKALTQLKYVQYGMTALLLIAGGLLLFVVFPEIKLVNIVVFCFLIGVLSFYYFEKNTKGMHILSITIIASVLINAIMNLHFYPQLLVYQGSSAMANVIAEQDIPVDKVYKIRDEKTWPLDFYNRRPTPHLAGNQWKQQHDLWVYGYEEDLLQAQQDETLTIGKVYEVDHFRVTRLNLKFLNPKTRNDILSKRVLFYLQ
ncbi:ArnT family glycosyltransferase [Membranihabitans marinus]|uniref:ArnT family glycosyltransferase n=1 Tax=Membranihabitans marinus TaxID=1227546 RepID=UPI001F30868F|nr:glycosyltransferase family 39 protein [Membranihabitans marinus]